MASLAAKDAAAQKRGHLGLPQDWSFSHVISHPGVRPSNNDPRAIYAWLHLQHARHVAELSHAAMLRVRGNPIDSGITGSRWLGPPVKPNRPQTDWHFTLGNGTVAENMSPAKFSFNTSAAPSCANDYVIFGLNVAGTSSGTATVGVSSVAISAASESGTTVTITTASAHGFSVAQTVTVAGVAISGYNGTFVITSVPTSNTFTYVDLSSGLATSTSQPNLVGMNNLYSAGTIGSSFPVTTASESGTTVTIVTPPNSWFVGESVTVSGITPSGYNGTFLITAISGSPTNSFTYTDVSGLGTASTSGATVIESGGLCGSAPTVEWAYNVSTAGGSVLTSPVLSLDGTQVAFIESQSGTGSAVFKVLTLGTNTSSGAEGSFSSTSNTYSVATPGSSGSNASVISTTYSSSGNTMSSPFVDYDADVAYFGDDNGNLYATNCVFTCTARGLTLGVATGWPLSLAAAGTKMAPPVLDFTTKRVFVGGSDGKMYMVPLASCPGASCSAATKSAAVGDGSVNGGIIDGVVIDNVFDTLFTTTGSYTGIARGSAAELREADLSTLATGAMAGKAYPLVNGSPDTEYYSNTSGETTATGNMYFGGANNNSGQGFVFTAGFGAKSDTISSATESGTTATITTSAAHGFVAGESVAIAGVGVAGYNGTFTVVSAPSTTTFTYTALSSGLASSSGGTATASGAFNTLNPPAMTTFTGAGIAGGSNVGQFSPFVVFTNPNVSNGTTNETLFFSEESTPKSGCSGASANGDGCIYAYPVTGSSGVLGTPASTSEHGYTSGLIIDNVSTSAQASSIYFASEATTGASNSAPNCTYTSSGTAAYCAVKLTQSGLK